MKEENAPAQTADADLTPEVQADQCLLEVGKALQNSDALNIEKPTPDFFFLYGKFLRENYNAVHLATAVENSQVQNFLDDLLEARSFFKQFLTQVERTAANYKPALESLSACQSTIKAVTPAAKEFEELQKIKKKKTGETLLIHLTACYTELVNTIVSAEDCASSARIQAASDYNEIVSALLNAAADVNTKNDNGETPPHKAAEKRPRPSCRSTPRRRRRRQRNG